MKELSKKQVKNIISNYGNEQECTSNLGTEETETQTGKQGMNKIRVS